MSPFVRRPNIEKNPNINFVYLDVFSDILECCVNLRDDITVRHNVCTYIMRWNTWACVSRVRSETALRRALKLLITRRRRRSDVENLNRGSGIRSRHTRIRIILREAVCPCKTIIITDIVLRTLCWTFREVTGTTFPKDAVNRFYGFGSEKK